MIFRSSQTDRLDYNVAQMALSNTLNLPIEAIENAQCTPSFLRSIIPLSASQTQYNFNILSNQNNTGQVIRPDEVRLNQQDAFYAFKMNMFIAKPPTATSTDYASYGWPNPVEFANTGLYQLYNGYYQIVVNNSVVLPAGKTKNFLQIPLTQLTGATNSSQDQFDGTLMNPLQPGVVFVGLNQINCIVNLPSAIGGTIDANSILILEWEGLLAQNVALGA